MATTPTTALSHEWTPTEKVAFRFFFIYFIIQAIPLDWKFFRTLFSLNWGNTHFRELLELTRYSPRFFSEGTLSQWGINSFGDWGVVALIALVGAAIWSFRDQSRREYRVLYYWLRVVLRYRLAIGIIAYGFIKLFPIQMPYPSLSNLNTNYGDFLAWKIYFHTLGIAPNYESFLGFVEIVAGFLLFYRKTVTFGAGLILGFLGNVSAANLAYDTGDHVYSSYLLAIALFLFVYDVPRLYNLLALQRPTLANRFKPVFSEEWIRRSRLALKVFFIVFVTFFGYKTYANFHTAPYLLPQTPGLKGSYGFYNVREFRLNDQSIPYSTTDPNRWQNVVFEKWSTLSVKINRPIKIDLSNGDGLHENDIDRNYELAGVGGRHYFYYETDTVNHTLKLQNKNKNYRSEKLVLNYTQPNDSTLVLAGINEKRDSVHLVLDKINKKYMMLEGRRKPVKL